MGDRYGGPQRVTLGVGGTDLPPVSPPDARAGKAQVASELTVNERVCTGPSRFGSRKRPAVLRNRNADERSTSPNGEEKFFFVCQMTRQPIGDAHEYSPGCDCLITPKEVRGTDATY